MKKRVLITGASGFVGYHLIAAALASDLEVYAAVRPSSNITHLKEFNINYTDLDFSNQELLRKELEEKQYSYIIHAAGITKPNMMRLMQVIRKTLRWQPSLQLSN
jgi:nucleoside-diphosphate-sugar epimerase